jgi:hypothetical protein
VTLLFVCFLSFAAPADARAADDAAIFQLIADDYGARANDGLYLLVADRTLTLCASSPAPPCLRDADVIAALKRAAGPRWAAFELRNRTPLRIAPLDGGVRMTAPETIAAAMDASGWDELYCLYPRARAVVYFSAPAYVDDEAIVYFEDACDLLCGSGWYVRLSRDGKGWKIVERVDLWVS